MIYSWLAIMVVCIIIEAATPQLVSIWFAVGALAALITSVIFPDLYWLQAVVFLVISVVAVILTRPLAKKHLNNKRIRTNFDRCIGQEAVVVEEINNLLGKGQVNCKGVIWTARSKDNEVIKTDTLVNIEQIEGVKVIVTPK